MNDTWYFAYGSNLSKGRKQERTGLIRCEIRAKLRDYRLAFNKKATGGGVYANIVAENGCSVWGVIYLCNSHAMAELDRREGVMGGHYERIPITVELEGGEIRSAETYVAGSTYIVSEGEPTETYLKYILDGAIEHELPAEYIAAIRRLACGEEGN